MVGKKEKGLASGLQTDEDIYIRPRTANKKMRAAQTISQTVYMYGISGCGKTSFIRDYGISMKHRALRLLSIHLLKALHLSMSLFFQKAIYLSRD